MCGIHNQGCLFQAESGKDLGLANMPFHPSSQSASLAGGEEGGGGYLLPTVGPN